MKMLDNGALGLAGEAGEVADNIKKIIYHGRPFNEEMKDKIRKELGDCLWYISMIADAMETTMEQLAQGNIDKLLERHPGPGVDFSYHDRQT
jgi:NTP pyrophosphatase (non-canonical NTP hydrolase)